MRYNYSAVSIAFLVAEVQPLTQLNERTQLLWLTVSDVSVPAWWLVPWQEVSCWCHGNQEAGRAGKRQAWRQPSLPPGPASPEQVPPPNSTSAVAPGSSLPPKALPADEALWGHIDICHGGAPHK